MAANFEFQPTTLLSILKDRYLTVPRYQRSYSWDQDQVDDFWNDITAAIRDDRDYFLGTIVLSTEDGGGGAQAIIDGQQRVSTATILLSCIRDRFKIHGPTEAAAGIQDQYIAPYDVANFTRRPRIRLNTSDHPFYEQLVVLGNHTVATTDSHRLMLSARDNLTDKIDAIITGGPSTWPKYLSNLVSYLAENVRVVAVKAPSDADAFTIFETLNDRGADLTIADLLKNFLFSASRDEIEYVQHRWIEAISILDLYLPNREFVNFLRHIWSSKYGATRERDLYRDIKARTQTKREAVELANFIAGSARLYGAILSSDSDYWKPFSERDIGFADELRALDLEQNRPLLLAIFQHFSPKEVAHAIRSLLSWSIRGLVAGVIGGGTAERYFCEAAVDVRSGAIKDVPELLQKLGPIVPSDTAFHQAFERFGTTRARLARYMLLAFERFLNGETEPELVPNSNYDEVNLEHILPKNAKLAEWPNFSPEEVGVFAHRMGNLTLLKKSENARIGNRAWDQKLPVIASSTLKLNHEIAFRPDWNKTEINFRQLGLAQLAVSVWPLQ